MTSRDAGRAGQCHCRQLRTRCAFALLLGLAACGGGGVDGITCGRMDGAWDIAHDAGTGPIGAQLWQVTQSGCDVSLKAMSADGSAATLFAGVGAAGDAGFWVAWTLTDGPCRVDGRVAVDVTADMLDGTVSEARSHRGAGECPGAGLGIVTARVHGTRR